MGYSGWKSCWLLWLLQRFGTCQELSVSNIETGYSLTLNWSNLVNAIYMSVTNFFFFLNKQPPPSFLSTMEEYIREAPPAGSVQKRLVRLIHNNYKFIFFPFLLTFKASCVFVCVCLSSLLLLFSIAIPTINPNFSGMAIWSLLVV